MEERQGDIRVPLISCLFCIFVTAGGVFLGIYVFYPHESEPWFLAVAFLMIGSPWVFWVVTYFYTCIKRCHAARSLDNRQISRRSSLPAAVSGKSQSSGEKTAALPQDGGGNSPEA